MGINNKNMGTYDTMHSIAENKAYLARNEKNDIEQELTTNHNNRIFHKIKTKIKGFLGKSSKNK